MAHTSSFGVGRAANLPAAGLQADLPSLLALIIRVSLALVGVVALGFAVYGGFRYISARGDEQELEAAKRTITQAVIGVVAVGLAFAIVEFAFATLGAA